MFILLTVMWLYIYVSMDGWVDGFLIVIVTKLLTSATYSSNTKNGHTSLQLSSKVKIVLSSLMDVVLYIHAVNGLMD